MRNIFIYPICNACAMFEGGEQFFTNVELFYLKVTDEGGRSVLH
jgi:hypothetical protein